MAFLHLTSLPPELVAIILEHMSTADLATVCLLNHELHDLATPVLYRTLDFGCHYPERKPDPNDGTWPPIQWEQRCSFRGRLEGYITESIAGAVPLDSAEYFPADLHLKQMFLVRTLTTLNPRRGSYVRRLRWTMGAYGTDEEYETWVRPFEDLYEEGKISKKELNQRTASYNFQEYNDILWAAFASMANVLSVDIAFTASMEREKCLPPPGLFPKLQSLRIGGIASRPAVTKLFESAPKTLLALHLVNLNEYAELLGVPVDTPLKTKNRLSETIPNDGNPGPMRGHLRPFLGKWQHLRVFTVETVGQSVTEHRNPTLYHDQLWNQEREEERYEEMGEFIASVAPQLFYFRFEQGVTGLQQPDGWHVTYRRKYIPPFDSGPGTRRMDDRFRRHILPSLIHRWGQLERMDILGFAGSARYDAESGKVVNDEIDELTRASILSAIGPGATLLLTPYARRCFWHAESTLGTGLGEDEESDEE